MRWDQQRIAEDAKGRLPGYAESVVRTFDAPEALDIRFHEVRTKSALNRVPGGARLPFAWTVNPYRGCTHACTYCLAGATPVLMADGRRQPIARLRPGDRVYGTEHRGGSRRCVLTDVLDHWSTRRRAYRVVLADGTKLVSSGDHRWLTESGWRHVYDDGAGRPHLAVGDVLAGTGRGTAAPPDDSAGAVAFPRRLTVAAIEPLGLELAMYDITTGTGDFIAAGAVSHNCFARPTHEYLELDARRDFEREIVVKVNVPEVLRVELARPSWTKEHVALGTNTDPYQWVERRYRLMRGIWAAMRDFANPCSILTKSPLVLRDVDLLKEIAEVADVSACLSVPTLDERAWRATEPHTPHPRARLEAVAELNRQGVPTGILIAPLMPGINDAPDQVERIVRLATEAGAVSIGGNTLFLRGSVRDIFFDWLHAHRPDLVPRYQRLYARGAYVDDAERRTIERAARAPWAGRSYPDRFKHRTGRRPPPPAPSPPPSEGVQPSLF